VQLGFRAEAQIQRLVEQPPPLEIHPPQARDAGHGAFAVVRRVWDVSTGIEYARKEPLDKRRFDRKAWEKEADIINQISHVS
jgi:hypothetical protein